MTDESSPASLMNKLPRPEAYSLSVKSLSISSPVAKWSLPLGVPVAVPGFIQRRLQKEENGEAKELLRDVNVEVRAGEVLALIGGSGSGKTTLLNTIAHRSTTLVTTSGAIDFAPYTFTEPGAQNPDPPAAESSSSALSKGPKHKTNYRKIVGYVRQDDFLLPYLTVRETLTFAASLRLPTSVTRKQRAAVVEQTINELGLREAAETICGGAFKKGLSGGEKRRLSIGCVLVTLPSVLVLDEPTTGLSSTDAFAVLETLGKLAKRGRIVVLSIHQPRSDCFGLFDKITLLSRGSVIYSGSKSKMLNYFDTLGYTAPQHANPLDFAIDISSVDTRDDEAEIESSGRVEKLVAAWRSHELESGGAVWTRDEAKVTEFRAMDMEKNVAEELKCDLTDDPFIEKDSQDDRRPGLLAQTRLVTARGLKNVTRNYGFTLGLLAQATLIGVILGLAFLSPPATPAGIQSIKTVIFQSIPAFFYLSIIVWVFVLSTDLIIFDRENEDGLVRPLPYLLGSFLSYLPGNIAAATVYSIIVYFMAGFRRDNLATNLLSFIAHGVLEQLSAFGYASFCCGINRSFAQASLLANGFSIFFILTAGYLIVDLPDWVAWLRWVSPYFYGFHWIARLQFDGRVFACEGVTGPTASQCSGDNVLVGLKFPIETPLLVYPLGLLGFVIGVHTLALSLYTFYHPGGVKHAATQPSREKAGGVAETLRKEKSATAKEKVGIEVRGLGLTVTSRSLASKGRRVEKVILQDIDATFPAGKITAILGPSGAGKSSLLQVLAGRLGSGFLSEFATSGEITFNGQRFDTSLASLTAFIEQEDAHYLPALTVRETLRYASRLRLPDRSTAQCDARAEEILRSLGLKSCADNLVGGALLKGISGGEKRRLSLAVQLISDPPVLFADEPTSGLDAYLAQNMMLTLKALADQGRTVVVSVHQPRSDIWDLFDHVLLLAKGGVTAYSGPKSDLLKTFDRLGAVCPPDFNPADFVLDTVSVSHRDGLEETRSAAQVNRIVEAWRCRRSVDSLSDRGSPSTTGNRLGSHKLRSSPFIRAFPVVLGRSAKNLRRQSDVFVARLINPPFLALIFWLFFARLSLDPGSAQTRVGVLQETTALPFVGMLACLAIFPTEKGLFLHEWKSSGRQSVGTFVIAYSVQESLISIVSSLLWSLIFMYGIKLHSSPRILIEFWWTSYALISTGESIGIIFSAFCDNGGLAVSLVSAAITMASQLNGIISVTLPHWLQIIGWASVMKSQARVQIINEFRGLVFDCTSADLTSGACIAQTGDQLLDIFSISPSENTGKFLGIALALTFLFRIFAYVALRIKVACIA